MRLFNPILLLLLLLSMSMLLSARPQRKVTLNMRRKFRRHHCPHNRCLPLHSRVPFP
ncbi:apelin receptor early endogenous ligand [Clupea harengus]|uniref:Apelin receptor early endogenous ligand n=1 Tax=Clupea harengus TaxID=7950 RepID=A0A8M1K9R5_CLUHA|nr:apelin receptor early endogenous ligand [Clupea harengus]